MNRNSINESRIFLKLSQLLFIVLTISLTACKQEKTPVVQESTKTNEPIKQTTEPNSNEKVILFYGNSLTAGYGLESSQSFPSLIEEKIDSLQLPYTVVNAGLSGETTSGGLKRIDWIMKQQVDIFILELGANDMLRGLPLEETKKNLANIIDIVKAKNSDIKIGLCEMMAPPNMGEDYLNEFSQIYRELSKPDDIIFIPFFLDGVADNSEYLLTDGKHPNAKGQQIVANNIWRSLEKML